MLAVKCSILCYFVAVISKVLLVNLLAALNFANVFFKIKDVWKIKKRQKKRKKRDRNKKKRNNVFTSVAQMETALLVNLWL